MAEGGPDMAIRFAAANPNVTVVLPGMYSPEEVAENAAAASDPIPAEVAVEHKVVGNVDPHGAGRAVPAPAAEAGAQLPAQLFGDGNVPLQHRGDPGGRADGAGQEAECGLHQHEVPVRRSH